MTNDFEGKELSEDDIFVEEDKTFPISIYYNVVNDENGNKMRIETSIEEKEGWRKIEGQFVQPSSQSFGEILEQATIINHKDFRPLLSTLNLRDGIIQRFMKSWDVKTGNFDEDGNPIFARITKRSVSELHYQISQLFFIEYMNKTGLSVELKAAFTDDKIIREKAKEQMGGDFNVQENPQGFKIPENM